MGVIIIKSSRDDGVVKETTNRPVGQKMALHLIKVSPGSIELTETTCKRMENGSWEPSSRFWATAVGDWNFCAAAQIGRNGGVNRPLLFLFLPFCLVGNQRWPPIVAEYERLSTSTASPERRHKKAQINHKTALPDAPNRNRLQRPFAGQRLVPHKHINRTTEFNSIQFN